MNSHYLKHLLQQVRDGELDPDSALQRLKTLPYEDLGYAKIDHHRCVRNGVPEFVYCAGKTIPQIMEILSKITQHHCNVLATRAGREVFEAVQDVLPDSQYHEIARIIVANPRPIAKQGNVAVVCAGTSDLPVGEEAAVTAEALGNHVHRFYDVGVAGIHRLLGVCTELYKANVAVVVAGMEGALSRHSRFRQKVRGSPWGDRCGAYVTSATVELDTEEQWLSAEWYMQRHSIAAKYQKYT